METFDKVLASIIGVGILAVIVSKNAQTGNVVTSIANGFSKVLGVVVTPVTQAAQNSAGSVQTSATGLGGGGSDPAGGILNAAFQSAFGQAFGTGANANDIVSSISSIVGGGSDLGGFI